ncbi:MAG: hypothetical protein ACOWWO_09630 [Peptococcaceae bacterium]
MVKRSRKNERIRKIGLIILITLLAIGLLLPSFLGLLGAFTF